MAYYWYNPWADQPTYLHDGNPYVSWGPVGFTVPGGGASLTPAGAYQPPAPPPQAIPAGSARALMPNTELAPAGLPAHQTASLAPANPDTYLNLNAAMPAATDSQSNSGVERAQGDAAAPSATQAGSYAVERAMRGRTSPFNAADAATARSTPYNQTSRASASIATAARASTAAAPIREDTAVIGDVQALWSFAGPPQAFVVGDGSASNAYERTVLQSDDPMTVDNDDMDRSEGESEEYEEHEDDEDGERDDDGGEDDADDEEDEEGYENDGDEDEEDDEDEDVPCRLRVTGPLHRWLGYESRYH